MTDMFIENISNFELPIHLVLDGARVSNICRVNIDDYLSTHGLVGRPLFRETAHRETVFTGPWLLSLGVNHEDLELAVVASRQVGKGVFWLGAPDDEILFQHLRKLAAAQMPDGRILYFRYYDSDVLAAIVPLANAQQAAHMFGPAQVIAFVGGCGDGAFVEKPPDLPEPASGPILFEPWQVKALDERQQVFSRQKIAAMLRSELPSHTKDKSADQLYQSVLELEASARSAGLSSESAFAKWAYLDTLTSGKVANNSALTSWLKSFSSADEVLEEKFHDIIVDFKASQNA